jgi:hypothetical protein
MDTLRHLQEVLGFLSCLLQMHCPARRSMGFFLCAQFSLKARDSTHAGRDFQKSESTT